MTLHTHINILAALALLAPVTAPAATPRDSLVAIKNGTLPPIHDDAVSRVVAADGRIVALGDKAIWVLEEGGRTWTRLHWRPGGEVLDAATDGRQAFLLLGARRGGPVGSIEKLTVASGSAVTRALPAPPIQLSGARAAVRGDTLYVAGTDGSGTTRLLAIDPAVACDRPFQLVQA